MTETVKHNDYLADTMLERIAYRRTPEIPGGRDPHDRDVWQEVATPFGNQNDLQKLIMNLSTNKRIKRIVVLGESGLGKTILLKRLCRSIVEEELSELADPENSKNKPNCLPVYVELRTLFAEGRSSSLPAMELLKRHIEESNENKADHGFDKSFLETYNDVVLLLDGLNENIGNADRILETLQKAFPGATWVISGQPQIMQVRELDKSREEVSGWSFYRVSRAKAEVQKEQLVPMRLRKHLGLEEGAKVPASKLNAANEYFKTVPDSISQSPRYVDLVASLIAKGEEELPKSEFGIVERCMALTLGEGVLSAPDTDIPASVKRGVDTRREDKENNPAFNLVVKFQKDILGCIGFYNVFAETPLQWKPHVCPNSLDCSNCQQLAPKVYSDCRYAGKWLRQCEDAGILKIPDLRLEEHVKDPLFHQQILKEKGPWNSDKYCVFDHDTTQAWAAGRLIEHGLAEISDDEAKDCVTDILFGFHFSQFSPSKQKELLFAGRDVHYTPCGVTTLGHTTNTSYISDLCFIMSQHDKHLLCRDYDRVYSPETIGRMGSAESEIPLCLIQRLNDESWEIRESVIEALEPMLSSVLGIRQLFLPLLRDPDWWIRLRTVKALGSLVRTDVDIRQHLIRKLSDQHPKVRYATVDAFVNSSVPHLTQISDATILILFENVQKIGPQNLLLDLLKSGIGLKQARNLRKRNMLLDELGRMKESAEAEIRNTDIFEFGLGDELMPENSFALHLDKKPYFLNSGTIKLGLLRAAKRELNIEWTAEDHKALYEIFEKEVYEELKKKFQEGESEGSDD